MMKVSLDDGITGECCGWKLGTGGSGASFRYQRTRIASNCG